MTQETRAHILEHAKRQFALTGYAMLSMRNVASDTHISPSVIYHYFKDKDELLETIYTETNTNLGISRAALPDVKSAKLMMRQRVEFQIDHSEDVVFVLKYFLYNRKKFSRQQDHGFVPPKAYLHIEEVLHRGVESGEYIQMDVAAEAKVITHAINGFLLEYYPDQPKGSERKKLADGITNFINRSIERR